MTNKKIFIVVVLVVIAYSVYSIFNSFRFHLVRSTPQLKGSLPTSTSVFNLSFNKLLNEGEVYKAEGKNSQIVKNISVKNKIITVNINDITDKNKYEFSIKNIKAKDGSIVGAVNFKFTGKYIDYSKLPKDQQEIIDSKNNEILVEHPILSSLPYGNLHFSLKAEPLDEAESGEISDIGLSVEILLSNSDVKIDKAGSIARYKQEVLDYIKSKGVDPARYKIIYKIIEPAY